MSIKSKVEIECLRCGNKENMDVWSTINVQINPKVKAEVVEGKINRLHCSICGFESVVPTNLLYHDMEKEFCVYFFPFPSIEREDFSGEFTADARLNLRKTGVEDPPDYFRNIHVVFTMDELVRYVIFRDKLAQQKAQINRGEGL